MQQLQAMSIDLGLEAPQGQLTIAASELLVAINEPGIVSQRSGQSDSTTESATNSAQGYSLVGLSWPSSTITWSFAQYNYPEDASTGDAFTHGLGPSAELLLQQAFARWSEVSGLNFVELPDSASIGDCADIRVGWADLPSPSPGVQVMGETSWWSPPIGSSFMPDVTIKLEDPTFFPLFQAPGYPIFYQSGVTLNQVMLHEIGHALGISHATSPIDIIYPVVSTANPDLTGTDVAAVQAVYPASAAYVEPPPTFATTDTTLGISSTAIGSNYRGPVSYLDDQFIYAGIDKINVASSLANVFIHGGPLDDALAAQSGQNVLDGGTGSNFLIGGSGTDTFFVDDRGPLTNIWSTAVGFHAGDAATVWGITPQDFRLNWVDNEGAAGFAGLTVHATAPQKVASLTLTGYGQEDLVDGRLSESFGYDPASGSAYMYIHANW